MSKILDERIVSMQFDNSHFEKNVNTSLSTLDKLRKSLNLSGASKGLESVNSAAGKCDLSPLRNAVENVGVKFSAMQVMATTALANITNSAVNAGKRIVSALTIDPIKTGLSEYETQINSVQTILANTKSKGSTLGDVNSALDELNTYADKTIYNFTEMTRNIGTFTAAGVDLDKSVSSIKGIANLAAVSGSTSQQASTAMYQLSQALAAGKVQLMDWNSVVNAGMGGEVFQTALKRTATQMGTNVDALIEKYGSFRESLTQGEWLTAEVLTETLTQLSGAYTEADLIAQGYTEKQAKEIVELADTAVSAATDVKTFTQLMDTLKESAQSGWTQTWELLIGDFEEAKKLWSNVSEEIGGFINSMSESRNNLLGGALNSNWDKMIDKINEAGIETSVFEEKIRTVLTEQGYNVDEMVKKHGSLKEAFTSGAVSSKWLTKALDELNGSMVDLSKIEGELAKGDTGDDVKKIQEALKGLNYDLGEAGVDGILGSATENAIKAFQEAQGLEITGIVDEATLKALEEATSKTNNLTESCGDLIAEINKMGGRELLIESFKNVWEGLKSALAPIKEAFREIFPPMTSEQLYKIIEKIHELTTKFKLSEEQSAKLKSTFKGLFSILDIGWSFVKSLAGGITKLLGNFTGLSNGVLTVTGSLGDWLSGLRDSIKESNIFGNAISGIVDFISSVVDKVKEFGSSIFDGFGEGGLSTFARIFEGIGKAVASVGKAIGSLFTGGSIESVFSALNTGLVGGILYKLYQFVTGFKDSFEGFGGLGENIVGILDGVKDCLGSFQETLKAEALKKIAVAMLILAGALWILSGIDPDRLSNALVAMAGAFGELLAAFAIFNKIGGTGAKGVIKSISLMVGMSVAILILASAMTKLSDLSWEEIGKGLAGLGGLMTELLLFLKFATFDKNMKKTATGLLIVSAAILILTKAMNSIANLSWEEIGKGLAGIGGLLLELGLFAKLTGDSKKMLSIGISMIALGASMKIFASAMADIGSMSWEEIGKGLVGIAGALLSVALAMKLMPKNMVMKTIGLIGVGAALLIIAEAMTPIADMSWVDIGKGLVGIAGALLAIALAMNLMPKGSVFKAVGIIGIATAILILNRSLTSMSSMSWEEIGKGLVTLAGSLLVLAGGLRLMKGTIAGSAALLVAAGALAAIAPVIKVLGGMKIRQIGLALLTIAGVLTVFGVAAKLLSPLIPAMLGMSTALLIFGAACALVGVGVLTAAIGISALGGSLVAAAASIVGVILEVTNGLGEIIVSASNAIIEGAPAIAKALVALIEAGCVALTETLPVIAQTLVDLFDTLIEYAPQLVDSLFNLLIVVFEKLSEKAPELVSSLTGVFKSIFGALKNELGESFSFEGLLGSVESISKIIMMLSGATLMVAKAGSYGKKAYNGLGVFAGVLGIASIFTGLALWQLPNIAKQLSKFSKELRPFMSDMKGIDSSFVDNIKTLGEAMSAFAGAGSKFAFGELFSFGGVSNAFGEFVDFIREIVPLMKEIALEVSAEGVNINYANLDAIIQSIKGIAEAAAAVPSTKGALAITKWGGGGSFSISSLSSFTKFIKEAVPKIKDMALELSGADVDINTDNLNAIVTAIGGLADAASKVPSTEIAAGFAKFKGGFGAGTIVKIPGLEEFTSFIAAVAPIMTGFALNVSVADLDENDRSALVSICEAVSILGDAASKIPPSFEIGVFAGFSKMGFGVGGAVSMPGFEEFLSFINAVTPEMSGFALDVQASTLTEADGTALASICKAVEYLGNAAGSAPGITVGGGVASGFGVWGGGAYVDVPQLTKFKTWIEDVVPVMSGFALDVKAASLTETDAAALATICQAVEYLGNAAGAAPGITVGAGVGAGYGIVAGAAYVSVPDLTSFKDWIVEVAPVMSGFAIDVSAADLTEEDGVAIESICKAAEILAKAASNAPKHEVFASAFGVYVSLDDLTSLKDWITEVAPMLIGIANGTFTDSSGNSVSITSIPDGALDSLASICEAAKTLAEAAGLAPKKEEYSGVFGKWVESTDITASVDWLKQVYDAINGEDGLISKIAANPIQPEDLSGLNSLVDVAHKMSEAIWNVSVATSLGNVDTSSFTQAAIVLKAFYDEVKTQIADGMDIAVTADAAATLVALKDVLVALQDFDYDNEWDVNGIELALEELATAADGFADAMAEIDDPTAAIGQINKLSAMMSGLAALDFSGVSSFQTALDKLGKTSINAFIKLFAGSAEKAKAAVISMVNKAATGVNTDANVSRFKTAGKDLANGLISGINSKKQAVYDAAYALGQKAVQGEKDGQASNSPSKLTIKAGKWFGEGLVIGINDMAKSVYSAGHSLGQTAVDSISSTVSRISEVIDSDIDTQPTIRPVLDLSEVSAGAGTISSLLNNRPSLGVLSNVGTINTMMNSRQNGANNDVISAINELGKRMGNASGDTININGITYDDGSNITDAVKTLVRAARVERRI